MIWLAARDPLVAHPNVDAALVDPGDIRLAANAILTLDALIGITFWFLWDRGDPAARKHTTKER